MVSFKMDQSTNKSTGSPITRNCSRCRIHGLEISQKGHKLDCMHRNCDCELCKLFSARRRSTPKRIRLKTLTKKKDSSLSIEGSQFVRYLKGSYDSNSSDLSVSNHGTNETQNGNNYVTRITSSKQPESSNQSPSATKSWPQWQNGSVSKVSCNLWNAYSSTTNNGNKNIRSIKTCTLCRNHNIVNIYKGHKRYCDFRTCMCTLCCETRRDRMITAKQVAFNRAFKETKEHIENLYEHSNPILIPQQINHIPTVPQPVWSVEGYYGSDGINSLLSTPTPSEVPVLPMMPPLIDSLQLEPRDEVEFMLTRSMTLLQRFQTPLNFLTLLYVIVKNAGADLDEAAGRITEASNDIKSWKHRMVENNKIPFLELIPKKTDITDAPTYEGKAPTIGDPTSQVSKDFTSLPHLKKNHNNSSSEHYTK